MADGAELRLQAAGIEATFLPEVGMLGTSLRVHGEELLALPGGLEGYRAGHVTGLPLLAPWANRLGRLRYAIAGADVDLTGLDLHDDGTGLPIHGTMTAQAGWEVVDRTSSAAQVRFDYGARPDLLHAFPFPHELVLAIDVSDAQLHVATTVRPTADRPVPISFGWHPYLALRGPRSEARVRLPDCQHLVLDGRGLPTGRSETQRAGSLALAGRAFDDGYALGGDRRLALEDARGSITVDLGDGYPFAQVYSPPDAAFACLEPMTAPTNALVTGAARLVEPGAGFTADFTISVTRG
jgi:galactose mutarotase-like enzyme